MAAKVGTDATQVTGVTQQVQDNELLSERKCNFVYRFYEVTTQQAGTNYMLLSILLMDTSDMSQYDIKTPDSENLGKID